MISWKLGNKMGSGQDGEGDGTRAQDLDPAADPEWIDSLESSSSLSDEYGTNDNHGITGQEEDFERESANFSGGPHSGNGTGTLQNHFDVTGIQELKEL
jgi:hypothetical protein